MKKILTVGLFSFFITTLVSQEDIVKKIRQTYIDYNKQITDSEAEGLDYLPPCFKINNVQNRPALGPVNISVTYYYDEYSNAEEAESYAELKNWVTLRKAVYTEGMPSYTDYKEMLYDEKGNLLFYYVKSTGYECSEKRFYFDKGKLIKIAFNPFKDEQCSNEEEFPTFTRYAGKLTKDDLGWEKWIIEKAQKNKQLLNDLYNSTQ
ncbi:MAG: hypothetical protein HC831_23210 [Chloroflexia bacterium]|nr:hypothetical protein [Chloroflexia bacterium]